MQQTGTTTGLTIDVMIIGTSLCNKLLEPRYPHDDETKTAFTINMFYFNP